MPPDDLSAEARLLIDLFGQTRRPNSQPRRCYHDLPPSARLYYDLLTWANYRTMLDLFGGDPSPFVMPVLKEQDELDEYAAYQLALGRYSGKRGNCDWFLRRADGVYVGVLHLYDVSFELFDGERSACFCGYAIGEAYRRQGYAEEALRHLLTVLPPQFLLFEAQAEPLRANEPSQSLLQKVGFTFEKLFENEWGDAALWTKKLVDPSPRLTRFDLELLI